MLRNNMDAAEYKHIVLGLIFLKYISDAFEAKHAELAAAAARAEGADPEDPDEYKAASIFWVPREARWSHLKAQAPSRRSAARSTMPWTPSSARTQPSRASSRRTSPAPAWTKPASPSSSISSATSASAARRIAPKTSSAACTSTSSPSFASAEGKKGGQFYTPSRVVRVLVAMLAPYKGRVYDPCCGSGGMFVSSERFIEEHRGRVGDISIYGQESNYTTWRLANMNLANRGIGANIAQGDSFHADAFPDLKADYVLANPPFNDSDWRGELLRNDKRWAYGTPPAGNANFAWVQHFIHHLAPPASPASCSRMAR